ncbi:cleavage and polyadenylation specificity factor, putative [Bodo saltans]|uniref:Cleavage and polyadenylation specificity factor, putative n=1 Tax=Bodo saltans TaxID=75058 RepID=A0A0S4JHV6_BODSA|nr:cleavage and polyadenylation specificity factor, putative [Bodo saltans]|eukprot:CUG87983.1 cleavage and polyadenylation specificity factor, putative [Bodo saltans]
MSTAAVPPLVVAPIVLASAVTNAARGNFSGQDHATELVVVKHNVLHFYRVGSDEDISNHEALIPLCPPTELSSPPLCLCTFRPPGRAYDVVALAFSHIHVSVVAFNPVLERVETLAAVLLRDDPSADGNDGGLPPFVRYDAERDLIAVYFYSKWLALLQVQSLGTTSSASQFADEGSSSKAAAQAASADEDWGDESDEDEGKSDKTEAQNVVAEATTTTTSEETIASSTTKQLSDDILPPLLLCAPQIIDCTQELKRPLRQVRDIQFVPSFSEPTIAILCEQDSSWAGRVKLADYGTGTVQCKSLSCSVVWLSVSTFKTPSSSSNNEYSTAAASSSTSSSRRHAVVEIGDVDGIPYSTSHMSPIPGFEHVPGGVLCFSHHSILHVTPKRRFGCFFNKLGREEAESDSGGASSNWGPVTWTNGKRAAGSSSSALPLLLSSLRSAFLSDRALVLCTIHGHVLHFSLESDGRSIVGSSCTSLGVFQRPSCVANVSPASSTSATPPSVFIGTTEGNSVVARLDTAHGGGDGALQIVATMFGLGETLSVDLVHTSNQKKSSASATAAAEQLARLNHQKQSHSAGASIDAKNPYAALFANEENGASSVADNIVSIDDLPKESSHQTAMSRELLLSSGSGAFGRVLLGRDCIVSQVSHRNNIECMSTHVVQFRKTSSSSVKKRGREEGGEASVLGQHADTTTSDAALFVILSTRSASIILRGMIDGKRLEQVKSDRCSFATNSRTIFAGKGLNDTAIVQVTERDIVLVTRDAARVLGSHTLPRPCGAIWASMWNNQQILILYQDQTLSCVTLSGVSAKGVTMVETQLKCGVIAAAIQSDDNNSNEDQQQQKLSPAALNWLVLALPPAPTATQQQASTLEVYSAPRSQPLRAATLTATPLVTLENFSVFPAIIDPLVQIPEPFPTNGKQRNAAAAKKVEASLKSIQVVELALVTMRRRSQAHQHGDVVDSCPTLFAVTEGGECVAYKVVVKSNHNTIQQGDQQQGTESVVRLIKKLHENIDGLEVAQRAGGGAGLSSSSKRETIEEKMKRKREAGGAGEQRAEQQRQNTLASQKSVRRLVPFDNMSNGYSGVAICGLVPRLVFTRGNGQLVSHRHLLPAGSAAVAASADSNQSKGGTVGAMIRSFSPLDACWLPGGFVCCCEGFIAFCSVTPEALQSATDATTTSHSLIVTKDISIGCTPQRVSYCAATKSAYVLSSTTQTFRPVKAPFDVELKILFNEDGSVLSVTEVAPTAPPPTVSSAFDVNAVPMPSASRYRLSVLALGDGNNSDSAALMDDPLTTFNFDENEEVLCSQLISLPSAPRVPHPTLDDPTQPPQHDASAKKKRRIRR